MDDLSSSGVGIDEGLQPLFAPRSVALVGLSKDPHKLNGSPLRYLEQHGFQGPIYPVNPKYDEIGGLRCYASIDDIEGEVDVAVVMVPAAHVPGVIRACGRKSIRGAVIFSSGFEESEEGKALADELRRAALEGNVRIVGPNCEGLWSLPNKAILTFGSAADREELVTGPVAILSQSGSIGGGVVRHLQENGVGCRYFVSVGNETLTDILDYLEYVIEDPDVRVVLLFIEGLNDGRRLVDLAVKARRNGISIVALKAGSSEIGQIATASHTGKLAVPDRIYRDIFTQCGVVQVDSINELVDAARVLSTLPDLPHSHPAEAGVGIFSIPGGTRALTADACEKHGVPLATFERNTVAALTTRLPAFGYAENPTDLTGAVLSDAGIFSDTLHYVAADPNVEAIVVQLANRGPRDAVRWRDVLTEVAQAGRKPVILSFLGDSLGVEDERQFAAHGIVSARDPVEAAKFLGWRYTGRNIDPGNAGLDIQATELHDVDDVAAWSETLARIGIGTPNTVTVLPADNASTLCAQMRFPVVVKALPSAADHKTELGLVRIGLGDIAAVVEAVDDVRSKLPAGASLIVQEMVAGGVEAVLSVNRNADFGPVLTLGAGGILVEVFKDVSFLSLPVTEGQVRTALDQLKLSVLLGAFRGRPAADVTALCKAAVGLSDYFLGLDERIEAIELNPIFVLPEGQGVCAVDLMVQAGKADGHG